MVNRSLLLLLAGVVIPASALAQGTTLPIVERLDQLPTRTYLSPSGADGFFRPDSAWLALSASLRRDLSSDLSSFDFRDGGMRRQHIWRLFVLHLAANQLDSASVRLSELLTARADAGLPPSGVAIDIALLAASRVPRAEARAALRASLQEQTAALTPAEVHRALSATRVGFMTELDSGRTRAYVERTLASAAEGRLNRRAALSLADELWNREVLAVLPQLVEEMTAILRSKPRPHTDIWPARSFSLDTVGTFTPVSIGVWDAGVDTSVLRGRIHVNPREVAGNGIDDDSNGFVDDVNGAGFQIGRRTTVLMEPAPFTPARVDSIAMWTRGHHDILNVADSPDAEALVRLFRTLTPSALQEFRRSVVQVIGYHGHGTQIAAIAVDGNPAARVLPLIHREWLQRNDSAFVTVEGAQSASRTYLESVDYLKQQGVRAVNASWGFALRDFENETRRLMPNATPEQQIERARELLKIHSDALVTAIRSAPEILFVFTAGNERLDIRQNGRIPSSLDMPNLITVGGAARDGDESTFTSFGKIDVYANSVERRAQLPGGHLGIVSAVSLAAPDVVNLAGKLWALYPRATVADIRSAIVDGADERTASSGRSMRLLNPLRSLSLMRSRQ